MAIKGGQIIHVGNDTALIDRLQTAGPGTVNIRRETIYELGNYRSVGQVSDIPDLSFTMESFDVSTEIEAFLLRKDPATTHTYDLAKATVVNIKSAFKPGQNAVLPFDSVASAAVPCLRLEQMAYRFGVGNNNARQTATLRGDSLYYNPGSTYIQQAAGTNTANQTIVLTNPAYGVVEGGESRRTLCITAGEKRLSYTLDYTETVGTETAGAASVTVTILEAVPTTDTIAVTYSSPTVESFPQTVHALVSGVGGTLSASASIGATSVTTLATGFKTGDTIILGAGESGEIAVVSSFAAPTITLTAPLVAAHASGSAVSVYMPTVKPAALRGRDIDVYIGPAAAPGTAAETAIGTKRHGVQSVDVDWRVTLQQDEEMGNSHYVDTDFDVPEVSGTVSFRPRDVGSLMSLVRDMGANTNALKSTSALDAPIVDLQVVLKNPVDGRIIKRLHVPDARVTVPGYSGRVQQKLDLQVSFQSEQGILYVYDS